MFPRQRGTSHLGEGLRSKSKGAGRETGKNKLGVHRIGDLCPHRVGPAWDVGRAEDTAVTGGEGDVM